MIHGQIENSILGSYCDNHLVLTYWKNNISKNFIPKLWANCWSSKFLGENLAVFFFCFFLQ